MKKDKEKNLLKNINKIEKNKEKKTYSREEENGCQPSREKGRVREWAIMWAALWERLRVIL